MASGNKIFTDIVDNYLSEKYYGKECVICSTFVKNTILHVHCSECKKRCLSCGGAKGDNGSYCLGCDPRQEKANYCARCSAKPRQKGSKNCGDCKTIIERMRSKDERLTIVAPLSHANWEVSGCTDTMKLMILRLETLRRIDKMNVQDEEDRLEACGVELNVSSKMIHHIESTNFDFDKDGFGVQSCGCGCEGEPKSEPTKEQLTKFLRNLEFEIGGVKQDGRWDKETWSKLIMRHDKAVNNQMAEVDKMWGEVSKRMALQIEMGNCNGDERLRKQRDILTKQLIKERSNNAELTKAIREEAARVRQEAIKDKEEAKKAKQEVIRLKEEAKRAREEAKREIEKLKEDLRWNKEEAKKEIDELKEETRKAREETRVARAQTRRANNEVIDLKRELQEEKEITKLQEVLDEELKKLTSA